MSSKRWPRGTLSRALRDAHERYPHFTAPQLARVVDCDPACARVVLRMQGLSVPKNCQRIEWTPELRAAIIEGAQRRESVDRLADRLGVSSIAIASGALAAIRELVAS